jgi:hypothetical protein
MMFLYDFTIFYNAALAVWAGTSPYAVHDFIGPYPQAMLFAPLALLPLPVAYAVYLAFNIYMLWRLLRKRSVWALLSFPVLFTLFVGQVDLPLMLGIGAVPWLLPLAMIKPQVGFILAPWLIRRYSKADWLKAISVGAVFLALSFLLRPGWVGEWLVSPPTFQSYSMRVSNLYYLIPDAWINLRMSLIYSLSAAAFITAFFLKERQTSWTVVSLLAPFSTVYSSAVLAEWIGPLEMAASYLAMILAGGMIHEGMPMYLVGLVILGKRYGPEIRAKFRRWRIELIVKKAE